MNIKIKEAEERGFIKRPFIERWIWQRVFDKETLEKGVLVAEHVYSLTCGKCGHESLELYDRRIENDRIVEEDTNLGYCGYCKKIGRVEVERLDKTDDFLFRVGRLYFPTIEEVVCKRAK